MRNQLPSISVIVPAYGVAHFLAEALDSLRAQDFSNWEAIVVDDGAPDDVASVVAGFAEDPRIRLLQTDNGGIAIARNRAVPAARAPLVCLLDGDDAYKSDYLSTMIAAIEADPALGFVTCDAWITGLRAREGQPFSRYTPQVGPITLERVLSRAFNVFVGCTIRRSALDRVGGFDGRLRSAEDLDLWIRLLEGGWQCGYVSRPLVRYRRRSDSLSADTVGLLRGTEQVYMNAAARLAGRPEIAVIQSVLLATRQRLSWCEAEALIRAGRPRDGVELLTASGADRRSLRWRIAMPIMRHAPWLAPTLIDMRYWLS